MYIQMSWQLDLVLCSVTGVAVQTAKDIDIVDPLQEVQLFLLTFSQPLHASQHCPSIHATPLSCSFGKKVQSSALFKSCMCMYRHLKVCASFWECGPRLWPPWCPSCCGAQ